MESLYVFAQANRRELTGGEKKKTIKVMSGEFGWRKGQKSVNLTDEEEKVIATLESLGKKDFVRVKKSVDKQAILKAEEDLDIEGIQIVKDDFFFVKPSEIKTAIKLKI